MVDTKREDIKEPKGPKSIGRRNVALSLLAIVILGLAIYSNSLHGEFISDDMWQIGENSAIKDIGNMARIFRVFHTRFMVGLSFAFNYWLGGFDVVGYHIFNLVIHILVSIFVFYFARITFRTPFLKEHSLRSHADLLAFAASLIFLCHPIQTESVSFITQRASSMVAFFYTAAFLFYIRYRLDRKDLYYIGAILMFIFGLWTKENMITLPVLLTIYEFCFLGPWRENLKERLKILFPFFLTAAIFVLALIQVEDGSIFRLKDQVISFSWTYFFAQINTMRIYLGMLFLPIKQQFAYPKILPGLLGPGTIFSFCLIVAIVVFLTFRRAKLINFCILWFFLTLSLELIHPCFVHKAVMFEHWLYLAMFGFSLFLPVVLFNLLGNAQRFKAVILSVVLILCVLTYARNEIWKNNFVFWQDHIRKNPENPYAYISMGGLYAEKGQREEMVRYFKKTFDLVGSSWTGASMAYEAMGYYYYFKNQDIDRAIKYYLGAIRLAPTEARTYIFLGLAYLKRNDFKSAERCFKIAAALQPREYSYTPYLYLGFTYAKQGYFDKAIEYFEESVRIDAGSADIINKSFNKFFNKDAARKK